MEYIIDAKGKTLGRIATEAANLLRGKNTPTFAKNVAPKVKVKVINAGEMSVTAKKLTDKYYKHYSGHPGGMKVETMAQVVAKKGYNETIRRAVYGMLPINKLRPVMIKNLIITE